MRDLAGEARPQTSSVRAHEEQGWCCAVDFCRARHARLRMPSEAQLRNIDSKRLRRVVGKGSHPAGHGVFSVSRLRA
jgi:hypothetical protein